MLLFFSFLLTLTSAASVSDLDKLVYLGIVKESERKKIKNIQAPITKLKVYILFLCLSGLKGKGKSFNGKIPIKIAKKQQKNALSCLNYSKVNPHPSWDKKASIFSLILR